MDNQENAKKLLHLVGGAENVKQISHCFTRIRFILKNTGLVNKAAINQLEGVISTVESGGQFQVVLGTKVNLIYDAMLPLVSADKTEVDDDFSQKPNLWNQFLIAVTAMFTPMVPAIAASGLMKGMLTIAKIIVANQGGDITVNQTYIILLAATDAIFYFMPLILAYTSAKVFKANEFVAMALGGAMCYPAIVTMMTGEVAVTMFGLNITKANYASSVIPIIIGVFILSYVQRFLEKVIPEVLKIILVPGISLFVMVPATFMIFGPIGIYIGHAITFIYTGMMNISPALCGAFIGGMWCVLVIFGAHRALLPIGINDVAQFGRQNLLAFAGAANFSQGGAALGVMLKTKNKDLKAISASAAISASICGITEPAIYGCNLRLKKPMIYAIIFGAVGGAIMGAGGVYGDAFANNGVLTLATYAAFGLNKFLFYLIGIAVAFFGAAIVTYLVGFEDITKQNKDKDIQRSSPETVVPDDIDLVVYSPVEGEAVSMKNVNDAVFSSEALGKGVAIKPTKGEVVAPDDCTVTLIYPTLHAVGLRLNNGVDLIIHVGIDTVQLGGKYFEQHVPEGSQIKRGTKIISFNRDKIKAEGFDPIVAIIVSNTELYDKVIGIEADYVSNKDPVIMIKSDETEEGGRA